MPDGKYPQFVLFQLTGDRCNLLDSFRVGDEVRVTFNVRGREWRSPQGETKYFNSLDVWKLEAARAGSDDHSRGNGHRSGSGSRGSADPRGRRDSGYPDDIPPRGDDDLPF